MILQGVRLEGARFAGGYILTDYSAITTTSATAFSYIALPGSPRTFLNYITSFGVTGTSTNTGSAIWNNSYSGSISFVASPITVNDYFSSGAVQFIKGDGSADGLDWTVMWFKGGLGDFDGFANSAGSAYFGSENTYCGGSNGTTVTRGRVWGFSPSAGWTLLYVLPLRGNSTYNHTNGNWFSSGGTVSGDYTILGKRTSYDSLSLTHLGFSVGTV